MNITFQTEQETDGRWIAEVPEIPGVMAYGPTEQKAIGTAEALALRALAERIEHGEDGFASFPVTSSFPRRRESRFTKIVTAESGAPAFALLSG